MKTKQIQGDKMFASKEDAKRIIERRIRIDKENRKEQRKELLRKICEDEI